MILTATCDRVLEGLHDIVRRVILLPLVKGLEGLHDIVRRVILLPLVTFVRRVT